MPLTRSARNTVAAWRAELGNDLVARSGPFAGDELTIAVDRIIERCVALRLGEWRGLVAAGTLAALAEGSDIAARIVPLCHQHFGPTLMPEPECSLDDPPLRIFLRALTNEPHLCGFATPTLAVLGDLREHCLARPLHVDTTGRAVEVAKSGARKSGGVYYTPAPIVDYLVDRALAPLLAEEGQGGGPDSTVLDPACGAGAFLLGAYRFLLDWHRQRYLRDPCRHADRFARTDDGTWRLSHGERRRILLSQIHGVDRDPLALETTRLTLLLELFAERGGEEAPNPPDLRANLRRGDSLIGAEIRLEPPYAALTERERAAICPFDWKSAFPAIMARGGFDAVIGNPPYLSFSGRQAVGIPATERHYLREHYRRAGWPAAHAYFIERAVSRLARRRIAFVVPDQVGHLDGYVPTRALLPGVSEVRYWGEGIFADALTPALTFVADRDYRGPTTIIEADGHQTSADCADGRPWQGGADSALLARLHQRSESLGALVGDIGVHTGNCARALIVPPGEGAPGAVPILEGKAIGRFRCAPPGRAFRADYAPAPGEYFTRRPEARYRETTFVIRQTAPYPIVGPRRGAVYFRNSLLGLRAPRDGRAVEYLVGLLNSRLLRYVYTREVRESRQRSFPQVKIGTLRRLPIRSLDLTDRRDRDDHDRIVASVRHLLALHDRRDATTSAAEHRDLDATIAAEDARLDAAIYELYRLTGDEVTIIDAALGP